MSLDVEKEQVVQALCAHYAQDHLSTGELEARFDRAGQAASIGDLRTVLDGLPALGPMVAAPTPLYSLSTPSETLRASGLPANEKRYTAIFAEVKKEGYWAPSPVVVAKVICGSILLDLREAALPPDGLDIDIDVIMGEAKVFLPPGVAAEVDCSAFMGSVEDKAPHALLGAPLVRVRGSTVMGSIVVQTKLPKKPRLESWRKQLKASLFGDDDAGLT